MNTLDEREPRNYELSTQARHQIRGTAPWLKLVGGIGIFFTALVIVGLLIFGGLAAMGSLPLGDMTGMSGALIVLFYIAYIGLGMYMSILLFTAGGSYKRFIETGHTEELEKALSKQRIFWLLSGVITMLMILLYLGLIVIMAARGGSML